MNNIDIELNNNLKNDIDNKIEEKEQKSFIQTTLGKTISGALDVGIRMIMPDLIEDEIIDIKNTILDEGLKEGINQAVSSAIDLGKSTMGIFTGNFENISQVRSAVKNGGIIDNISDSLDFILNKLNNSEIIDKNIVNLIKKGKNSILDNVSKNIENEFTNQISSIEKLEKYETNWKNYFNDKDFEGMEKEYKKIKSEFNNIIPLENVIKNAKNIENLHLLIKNNGRDFNLSEEQLKLAEILV